ncbi:Gfo/Idh/MocA family oxidoreductase [soil metagenome]
MASDGMTYAPVGKPTPVCKAGEFVFAATHLDHGHIYGQCNGLIEAGGELRWVYDSDPKRLKDFCERYPTAKPAPSLETILEDPSVQLVAAAAIPNLRGPLGCQVMEAGKDYFTDKTPFTTLDQLASAREVAAQTGRKYMVYYSERLHVECAVRAGQLIEQGAIGRVIQLIGTGPHRLNAPSRPGWFFDHEQYGGILCDIGSHQCEQFLYYTGALDARVNFSAIANYNNPAYPGLEDFGEMSVTADNGASGYMRVDWFTPDGLRTWGDGRTIIMGTKGYIELRKYIEVGAVNPEGDQLYLVDEKSEHHISCAGQVGYPFFGQLILDCLNRTENAMTQAHAFKAAELCLQAQVRAVRLS